MKSGSSLANLKARVAIRLKQGDKYCLSILAAVTIYASVLSWFMIEKHAGFGTFAWDLGIFNQAFHSTLFNGKLFYFTCELYLNQTGSYFASKFSPILFLALPFYALWPSPEALLVLKSIILGLAAAPLYLLSSRLTGSRKTGLAIGIVYLLYPAVQASNAFDFQPQAFIPVTFFSLYYFMVKGQWKSYFLFVFLGLMIEEHVAIILFFFSLMVLVSRRRLRLLVRSFRNHHLPSLGRAALMALVTMVISGSGYLISRGVRETFPLVSEFVEVYRTTDGFHVLGGTNDIVAAPFYAVLNPQRAFEALSYDWWLKALYILFLFGPLLFLSFRSRLSVAAVALLVPFLLSNYSPYYSLGAQYALYFVPLVFLAAVEGLAEKGDRMRNATLADFGQRSLKLAVGSILIVTIVFSVFLSPISPLSQVFMGSPQILWYSRPYQDANYVRVLEGMVQMVPSNGSVLTQNDIFPHFSDRMNAYVLPVIKVDSQPAEGDMENYVRGLINMSDYILLDCLGGDSSGRFPSFVIAEAEKEGVFKTCIVGRSAVLLSRGGNDSTYFVPDAGYEVFRASSDFSIMYGDIAADSTSDDGSVAFSQKGAYSGTLVVSPYVFLPPGPLEVTFEVKFGSHDNAYLGSVEVSENGGSALAQKALYGDEALPNVWTNYTLAISSSTITQNVELRVSTSGSADMYLDRVIIQKVL